MDTEHAKKMMDAFYKAKRIRDQLPSLPEGINPSYINFLDAISFLSKDGKSVRVSDVARYRNLPVPGVTRTLKEMEQQELIRKETDETDHRVIHIVVTDRGYLLLDKYVSSYFHSVTEKLSDISNEEIDEMIRTIDRVGAKCGFPV